MPPDRSSARRAARCTALGLTLAVASLSVGMTGTAAGHAVATGGPAVGPTLEVDPALRDWIWPADRFRVAEPYAAPAHEYGPGHRGIDLDLLGGGVVRAPADGVVAFAGSVAGRGILTIDHGDGLVTTLEPVDAALSPGTPVRRGEDIATLAVGGHAAAGELHFGVRLDGRYINPQLLLGGVPRAVLLPCCE